MKKYLFLVIAAAMTIGYATTSDAQNTQMRKERKNLTEEQMIKIRTDKMAQTLMLDDETTAKFEPVYSQYLKERMDCKNMTHKHGMQKGAAPAMKTDAEVEEMITSQFAQSHKMLDIREKYYAKLRKFLSPKQILKIYNTERTDLGKMKKEMQMRKNRMKGMWGHRNLMQGDSLQSPNS